MESRAVNKTVRTCCEGWGGPHCSQGKSMKPGVDCASIKMSVKSSQNVVELNQLQLDLNCSDKESFTFWSTKNLLSFALKCKQKAHFHPSV